MSYEFTKLSEVPVVDEFPEGANDIIETNGEIKRCPPSNTPKPLTYDYMPEGYPTKSVRTVTVMEEQELAFAPSGDAGSYVANLTNAFEIVIGQTYTVNWDGTVYECVCSVLDSMLAFGNLSIAGAGNDTGEPFVYGYNTKQAIGVFGTTDTSASHTISVKKTEKTVTPIAEEFLPTGVTASIDNAQTAADNAQTAADNAQTAAENAQTAAENAQRTADNAEVTANNAKSTADNAKATADAALPKRGGEVSGVIKSSREIEFPRKYDSAATPINGLRISSDIVSKVLSNRLRSEGVDTTSSRHIETIVTYLDGIIIYNPNTFANGKTVSISANGELLAFLSEIGQKPITISAKDIILQSSTADSTKKFKITVDDSGTLAATEVT